MEMRRSGHTTTGEAMFDAAALRREDVHEMSPKADQIAAIFSEHADLVWRSMERLGVPVSDIDDALQEVFLVVYRRIAEYEDRGLIRAWLFSISRQVARHFHRSTTRAENRHLGLVVNVTAPDLEETLARREAEK